MQRLSSFVASRRTAVLIAGGGNSVRFASSSSNEGGSSSSRLSSSTAVTDANGTEGHSHNSPSENATLILESLKRRDFTTAQAQAYQLAQHGLHDEYTVAIACLVVFLITFYWARSSHHSAVRTSAAQTSNYTGAIADVQRRLDDVTQSTSDGLARRTKAMTAIQRDNGELTTVIDQMTAALRQC